MLRAARSGTGRLEVQDALIVAAAKIGVSAAVLLQGFRALSDDDYARIVIAQRFAAHPSLDPSGTSWLPFPFWVHGSVMALCGREPNVARVTAIALGVVGALFVWVAARWLGASRGGALLGALLACAFPYSAWLGVATVPEAFTAALVVFGSAAASMPGTARVLGALALCAACLSRYEAWPAAALFAGLTLRDAMARRSAIEGAAALIALAAPAAWIVHGVYNHEDAMFFLTRVAAYRKALGGSQASLLSGLVGYPLALLRCEPELVALAAIGLFGAFRIGDQHLLERYRRSLVILTGVLTFLVAGDVFDGAPTHHAERALLAIWFGVAIVAGDTLVRAAAALTARERKRLAFGGAATLLLCAGLVRPWFARRDSFIDREAELEIGRTARAALGASDRLGIYTVDFGFFAVIAGFSAPERAIVIDEHDPRKPASPAGFTPRALTARLNAERASWLIVPSSKHEEALVFGAISVERGKYVLMRSHRP
jgi:hypothetical protein